MNMDRLLDEDELTLEQYEHFRAQTPILEYVNSYWEKQEGFSTKALLDHMGLRDVIVTKNLFLKFTIAKILYCEQMGHSYSYYMAYIKDHSGLPFNETLMQECEEAWLSIFMQPLKDIY